MQKSEPTDPPELPIRLKELLRRIFHYQREQDRAFDRATEQRAAEIAIRNGVVCSPAQVEMLGHSGGLEQLRVDDSRVYRHLLLYFGEAERELLTEQWNARLSRTVWQYTESELREALQKEVDDFEERLRRFCVDVDSEDGSDALSTEIARLDGEGFTERLLAGVREAYPNEAATMNLPNPDGGKVIPEQDLRQGAVPIEPKIPPRATKAHNQYQHAVEALKDHNACPTDREAYELLEGANKTALELGEEENPLPEFGTWQRNLREYRRLTQTQKNAPRSGRAEGKRSFPKTEDIEPQSLPVAARPRWADNK
ncbi:MAG: hypothetical protein V3W34_02565 [Phycisphaerae bacterium]